MRFLLSILLACVLLLTGLWTIGSIFYLQAGPGVGDKALTSASPLGARAAASASLSLLNRSLALNPNPASPWQSRSKLVEFAWAVLPPNWQNHPWPKDLMEAIVRSPADVPALLRLALTCASQPSGPLPGKRGCSPLFEALFAREPKYGYGHFRYAEYLYGQALRQPGLDGEFAAKVCRNYGLALSTLAETRLLRDWHEDQAIYNCTNLAGDFSQMKELLPASNRQWFLLGQGMARKGDGFWAKNQATVLAYLREGQAPLYSFDGLAHGMAKATMVMGGAEVLDYYVSHNQANGRGWEALIRYLDKHQGLLGPEQVKIALYKAAREAKPELRSGIYLLNKSCQLGLQDLALYFFQRLTALEPGNYKIYGNMARCQMSMGHRAASIGYFQKALSLNPGSANLHVELAKVYRADKQYESAVDHLQKALELNPGSVAAKQELRRMGIF